MLTKLIGLYYGVVGEAIWYGLCIIVIALIMLGFGQLALYFNYTVISQFWMVVWVPCIFGVCTIFVGENKHFKLLMRKNAKEDLDCYIQDRTNFKLKRFYESLCHGWLVCIPVFILGALHTWAVEYIQHWDTWEIVVFEVIFWFLIFIVLSFGAETESAHIKTSAERYRKWKRLNKSPNKESNAETMAYLTNYNTQVKQFEIDSDEYYNSNNKLWFVLTHYVPNVFTFWFISYSKEDQKILKASINKHRPTGDIATLGWALAYIIGGMILLPVGFALLSLITHL